MATVNVVTPTNLANEFDQGVQEANLISLKLGDGLSKDGTGFISVDLTLQTEDVYGEVYFASSANGTTQGSVRNTTLTRTNVGRWTVALSPAHPDGVNYHPTITAEEQGNLRDTPDITVVQGTKTANGFNIQITTGDNGDGADVYVDTPFTIGVCAPTSVVTDVILN